ncbi:MAG: hypothetical protein M1530_02410 [Candidatus Marsarchaeota archaeon]|nr:hypothetical protein [Candidatus Marsarchaeota archaeon]
MRKEAVFILLLIIAVVAVLSLSNRFSQGTETDARKFFSEDLARTYPDADVREILSSVQVGEGSSAYYLLSARVSYNLSTSCPTRWEVAYYYPPQSFVARRPQQLVGGCRVCGGASGTCVLSYAEEAIIASHTDPAASQVRDFLSLYPDAKPSVSLLPSWQSASNVWQVNWTAGDYGLSVYLSQGEGRLLEIQSITPPASP